MTIGIVILSRFTSSRLPGKALREIDGKPILQYIVERVEQVVARDRILIATSDDASDDPIASFATNMQVQCFRGSLENVAERFYLAAVSKGWDYAVRINGDNLFVDTELLTEMIGAARTGEFDFISNVKGRTFPKGMSIEIVRTAFFGGLLKEIGGDVGYREHVTLYLYDHEPGHFKYFFNRRYPEASGIQLALDTSEDLARSAEIVRRFRRPHWVYNLAEILQIWKEIKS